MIRIRPFDYRFAEMLSARTNLAVQRLHNYVADPSPDNVHDIRTSIRRLEAAYTLIPRPLRRKKMSRFVCRHSDFLKLNGPIRDCDIMLEKVDGYGHGGGPFAEYLRKRRRMRLRKAMDAAVALSDLAVPRPRIDSYVKITARFRKKSMRLVTEIPVLLHAVSGDDQDQDKDRLHRLRIATKRLRYLMEMQPDGGNDMIISGLRNLQDILGRLHDSDMFVAFASKRTEYPNVGEMIDRETAWRRGEFMRFFKGAGLDSGLL